MITTEPGGRAALVTGGSRGIVRRPASEGASLACLPATSSPARRVLAARAMGNLDAATRLGGCSVMTTEDLGLPRYDGQG